MSSKCVGPRGAQSAPRTFKAFQAIAAASLFAAAFFLSPQTASAQFVQQGGKISSVDVNGQAQQGASVSLSSDGNTAIVGGPLHNIDGAAWIYTRDNNGTWTQQARLTANDATGHPSQGSAVALSADGKTAIVGGYQDNSTLGAAWIYVRDNNGNWTQQGPKLVGSGSGGLGRQGSAVAMSADGNTAIVGGPADAIAIGAAWIYVRDNNGNWTQQGPKLTGNDIVGQPEQGWSVALSADGNTALVGGTFDNNVVGAAWVYTRDSNGTWTQQGSKLSASEPPATGQGWSVALSADGNTAAIGAPGDNSGPGAAWIFTRDNNGTWGQQGKLAGSDVVGSANLGVAAALSADGNVAAIGGYFDNSAFGATWVFARDSNGIWNQQGSKLIGSGADASGGFVQQGSSVALSADGNTLVTGGIADNHGAGAVWVFVQPAIVSSVSQNAGSVDGGELVSITGNHLTGASTVTFGGIAATGATVIDETRLLVTTPAHAAGTVDVAITTSGGTTTSAGAYTYNVPTLAIVLSSHNPSVLGQPVKFTAYLGGNGGPPTGSVTFKDGAATLGSAALSAGMASMTTSTLAIGSHSITAVYGGNGNFGASVSAALTQTVSASASRSTLTASPNPAALHQTVTFTATVASAAGTPSGTVTFKQGAVTLGTATLSSGKAVFQTHALTVGSHNVTATYAGNATWAASTSNTVIEVVDARVRNPFQVNSFNGSKADLKQLPAVAALGGGGFVVVWESKGEDGSGYGIYGQIFKANGLKSGGEFKVNTTTSNDQTEPAVAALSGGGFVVVWRSAPTLWSVHGLAILAQRYGKTGVRVGGEFKINTTNASDELQPAVAGLSDGGFVATWTANGPDGSGLGVYAQRYGKTGAKSGVEFKVNTTTAGDQQMPSVAALGSGFVVAWASNANASFGYDVYGQRFDDKSVKLGGEFLINTLRVADQTQPAVASSASGFVVAWSSAGQDGSGLGVYAQRFDASGAKLGGEFKVNTVIKNDQSEPAVTSFADGGFVVVWTSQGEDGSGKGVYGQAYGKNGNPLGTEFLVNTTTANNQWQPRVAALSATGFVVVWTAIDPKTLLQGIDGQLLNIGGL